MANAIVIPAYRNSVVENDKIKLAVYCRVSTDSEDQQASFSNQIRYYTLYAQEHTECELIDIYADEGISGTSLNNRDEFNRMLKDCDKGKIDKIICKSLSRFARNTRDCLTIIRKLKDKGIVVIFEKENIDTSKMTDEVILTIRSSFAQSESFSISQNIRRGAKMRMLNGTFIDSMVPYGYIYDKKKRMIVNEDEAKIVKWIFEQYLNGFGAIAICRQLEENKIPYIRNFNSWESSFIYRILTNEKYIGDTRFMRRPRTDELPSKSITNTGQKESYYAWGTHEGIIDKDTYEQVQELLKKRTTELAPRKSNKDNILYGKITCGNCGGSFTRKMSREKPIWVCCKHSKGNIYCNQTQVFEEEIINAYLRMLNKLTQNRKVLIEATISQLKSVQIISRKKNSRLIDIENQLLEKQEKIHILTRIHSKGFMEYEDFIREKGEVEIVIKKLQQEKKTVLQDGDLEETIDELEKLNTILSTIQDINTEIDTGIFNNILKSIIISGNVAKFLLLGNIEFEEIVRSDRYESA